MNSWLVIFKFLRKGVRVIEFGGFLYLKYENERWDVAIKMNSSIHSTNVLVGNLKPQYWALWPRW